MDGVFAFGWRLTLLKLSIVGTVFVICCSGQLGTITVVEKVPEGTNWEFRARTVRHAQVSKQTWDEYMKYKEQSCRLNMDKDKDPDARAADYLDWEEMTFHKSLRLKILPSLAEGEPLSFEDAVMLSKVDGRLLTPEPESLCKFLTDDDTELDNAEKDRFEDKLISRLFREELRSGE